MGGANGVGGDLVLYHGGIQDGANQSPCAASGANGNHADFFGVYLALQIFHHAARCIGGVAFRPKIGAGDDRAIRQNDDAFSGNRTGVDTKECVAHQRAFLIAIMS